MSAASSDLRINLPEGIDSGDIVLFSRKCANLSPPAYAVCIGTKVYNRSRWDHIGLVIKSEQGEPLILTADSPSVQLRPLSVYVASFPAEDVAIRRLAIVRSNETRRAILEFAKNATKETYKQQVLNEDQVRRKNNDPAQLEKPSKDRLIGIQWDIQLIRRELQEDVLTLSQRRALQARLETLYDLQADLESKLSNVSGKQLYGLYAALTDSKIPPGRVIADAYRVLGLLPSQYSSDANSPRFWSTDQTSNFRLLKNAVLGPEEFIKKGDKLVQSGLFDGPKNEALLSRALRRTVMSPVLDDVRLRSKLFSSFKRVVIQPGQQVTTQGDVSDALYVVESGSLERIIFRQGEYEVTNTLTAGNCIGHTTMPNNTRLPSSVRAKELSVLWKLDRSAYQQFSDHIRKNVRVNDRKERTQLYGALRTNFLFRNANLETNSNRILDLFFRIHLKPGEQLFARGEHAENLYIIKSGELDVLIDGKFSHTLRPGDFCGSQSLMFNRPHLSSATARTDVECWTLPTAYFHQLDLVRSGQELIELYQAFATPSKRGKSISLVDFLRFAKFDQLHEGNKDRIKRILIAWATRGRIGGLSGSSVSVIQEVDRVSFTDFLSFDAVLNHPDVESEVAFLLCDPTKRGRVSLQGVQQFVKLLAGAQSLSSFTDNSKIAQEVFANGRTLSAVEFQQLVYPTLPEEVRKDIRIMIDHLKRDMVKKPAEAEPLSSLRFGPAMIYGAKETLLSTNFDPKLLLLMQMAALVSQTVGAPLERVQILRQTASVPAKAGRQAQGPIKSLSTLCNRDGGMKSLFRGNGANLARIFPAAAIQLGVMYGLVKHEPSGLRSEIVYGLLGGIVAAAATYPLDVVRARLAIQKGIEVRNFLSEMAHVARAEGVRTLFRGFVPSIGGVFPYVGINFGMYHYYALEFPNQNETNMAQLISLRDIIIWATLGNIGHQLLVYPLDTCRRRMQVSPTNVRVRDVARELYKAEGVNGLYRGVLANQLRIFPSVCAGVFTFELLRKLFVPRMEKK